MPSLSPSPDIILFGGAFDPPHQGHLQCAEQALGHFPNAEVWFMPGAMPAGAAGRHKTPNATFKQRFEMCEILTHSLARTKVSQLEAELRQPNYTGQTLLHLVQQYPDKSFGMMIGQDQLQSFPNWKDPHTILTMASLIVVRRTHSEHKNAPLLLDAESALEELKLSWRTEQNVMQVFEGARPITLLDVKLSDAESSVIREYLTARKPVPTGWLPSELLSYINSESIYGAGSTPP